MENQTNPGGAEDQSLDQKAMEDLNRKKTAAGDAYFVYDDRVFVPIMPRVNIPGIGRRTALEICADGDAQKYLVEENAIGTVIREIV